MGIVTNPVEVTRNMFFEDIINLFQMILNLFGA